MAAPARLVGIQLFGQHVAPWLIVLSIFAVNFRHVLYSAGIGRRIAHWPVIQQAIGYFILVDPQYRGGRGEGAIRRGDNLRLVSWA
jgi:predicted branched-subunit amino acid permease